MKKNLFFGEELETAIKVLKNSKTAGANSVVNKF